MEFEDIFNEYFRDVFHFALGITRDRAAAEDVTQETFVRAMKHIGKYDGLHDIRAWLFTIARNVWRDMCRKGRHTAEMPEDHERLRDTEAGIEERIADSETAFAIHRFLHGMPEPYKEVFNLRVFGELPYERIGMIFGKSPGWARVVFYRAKKMIWEKMEDMENGEK